MIETIKEYLVSLGFKVDDSSLNNAQRAMRTIDASVSSFAGSSGKNFAKAATGVIAFVATANLALGKFITNLAQADLETEMFARRMWMSKDAAKAYQSSIDALGVSIDELYLSPELMQKYLELNKESRNMAVPTGEYDKQMQGIRDITFQFQRLKLEGTYALQWIGYYLTKYLAGPMGNVKDWLTKINDKIQETMPQWTKRIAEVASWFVRLGAAAWSIKGALGAIVGVFAAFKMVSLLTNPLAMLILGMTALLLLVDDFNTYQKGGESAFPELWKWLDKMGDRLKASGLDLKTFKDDLENIAKSATQLEKTLDGLVEKLGIKGGLAGVIKTGILSTLELLDDVLQSINMGIKELNDYITGKGGSFFSLKDANAADKKYEPHPEENGEFPMDKAALNALNSIYDFFTKNSFGDILKNIKDSPWSKFIDGFTTKTSAGATSSRVGYNANYLYPQNNTPSMTQVKMNPVYNIYGATSPESAATTVNRTSTAMITRMFQGVNR